MEVTQSQGRLAVSTDYTASRRTQNNFTVNVAIEHCFVTHAVRTAPNVTHRHGQSSKHHLSSSVLVSHFHVQCLRSFDEKNYGIRIGMVCG